MTRSFFLLIGLAVVVAACSGTFGVDPGEAVRPPELGPPRVEIKVIAGDDLAPLAAHVSVDGISREVQAGSSLLITWLNRPVDIVVTAGGFHTSPLTVEAYPEAGQVEFRLDPVVLRGRVTTPEGMPLPGTRVSLGSIVDTTDAQGLFRLERAQPGEIQASRPAWNSATLAWDGGVEPLEIAMEPLLIRAVRLGGDNVANPSSWREFLRLADDTAVNGFVIDIKDEFGTVLHDTEVARAHEIGAVKAFYDLDDVVADMDRHDLYKIARLAAFQDSPLAAAEPEHAVLDEASGNLWENQIGERWLDPSDPASHGYVVDLAAEACRHGFDEIQFDYVSYPFGGDTRFAAFDGAYTEEVRVGAVVQFLEHAHSVLNPMGCAVAANVLAITLESTIDEGVGQRPGPLSRVVDVMSPMIYTYNYLPGWMGFDNPDEHAVEIVDAALAHGENRREGAGIYRPWLQTFRLDSGEILAVQDVAESHGLGWMLWSNNAGYTPAMLPSG